MSKTESSTAAELLKGAQKDGDLSMQSMQALTALDIGAQIQEGLGVTVDDVQASEVFLITNLIDDSSSIRFGGNVQHVKDGHNLLLGALAGSKQKEGFLVLTRYLNGKLLFPYRKLVDAEKMDAQNYNPNGDTPLYDQMLVTFATVIAKTKEFDDAGVASRSITVIVSDGADTSSRATATQVRAVVEDMLKKEKHILAFLGVEDGSTDFRKIAQDCGIRPEWLLTTKSDPKEIRKAFNVISQSALRASQNAASFSKTALGGFGTP